MDGEAAVAMSEESPAPGTDEKTAGTLIPEQALHTPRPQHDSAAILRSLLEKAVDAVGAQHGMALVVDPVRQMVVCRAVCRLPNQHTDSLFFKLGQGNTGRVAATGKPIRLNDRGGPDARSTALLIVPVMAGDQIIAVLNLNGSAGQDGFSAQDQAKVQALVEEAQPRLQRALDQERIDGGEHGAGLATLVQPERLKEIQETCTHLLGVPWMFVDAHGRCLTPISQEADLCVLMRSRPGSALQCELSMAQGGARAEESGPCSFECHAGVLTAISPIFAGDQYLGAFVAMLRYQARDAAVIRARAAELGIDPYEALAKASRFPSVAVEQEPLVRLVGDMVARLVGSLAEARIQVNQERDRIYQKSVEMNALREVTQQLTAALDLDQALAETLKRAISLSSAAAAELSLVSGEGRLEIRSTRGLSSGVVELLKPVSESPAARAIATGRTWIVEDVSAESRFPSWSHAIRRDARLRSVASFVLGPLENPIGALTIYRDAPGSPDDDTIQVLLALCDRAALAIRSVRATAQARSNEQALRLFLARLTRGLSSSLDVEQLVQWIADFAVEMGQASHGIVYELVGRELRLRATARTGRAVIERPTLQIGEGLSGQVAATRRVIQVPDVRKDPRFVTSASSIPPDAARYVGIPMLYKGEVMGVLAVHGVPDTFRDEDLQLLGSFAGQAAIAIQNARSYEHQRTIANTMQQSFLPREKLGLRGLDVGPLYEPASEDVGGDYYDFLHLGDTSAAVVLGDVSGKGIRAATYTAMGKYVLRAYAFEDPTPHRVLERMNALLAQQMDPGTFITLFYGVFDLKAMKLHYASGGHPDGLLYRPGAEKFLHLPSTGLMVGAMHGQRFESKVVSVIPGDILVLYTDGVIEARRGEELFGLERLKEVIAENAHLNAVELSRAIYARTTGFQGNSMADDTCILVFRLLGEEVNR